MIAIELRERSCRLLNGRPGRNEKAYIGTATSPKYRGNELEACSARCPVGSGTKRIPVNLHPVVTVESLGGLFDELFGQSGALTPMRTKFQISKLGNGSIILCHATYWSISLAATAMDEELRGILIERIEQVCHELAKRGSFAINDAADQVITELRADNLHRWERMRDHFAIQSVTHFVNRVIAQAKAADPAQRRLPGLESLPLLITSEGAAILAEQLDYGRYQEEVRRLEQKIKSYRYKRRKPENLEQDILRLQEMKRFDPRFASYSQDDPDLTLGEAKQREASEANQALHGRHRKRH